MGRFWADKIRHFAVFCRKVRHRRTYFQGVAAKLSGTTLVMYSDRRMVMFREGQWTSRLFRLSFLALVGAALFLASCSQKQVAMEEPNFEPTPGKTYHVAEVEEPQTPQDIDLDNAYFDTDRASLKPHAKRILKKHAEWMKKHPTAVVQIEGVCDERGTYEHNIKLGDKRAASAKRFLVSQGINPSRIETISRGAVAGSEPRKMARNRRAAFIVYYSGE